METKWIAAAALAAAYGLVSAHANAQVNGNETSTTSMLAPPPPPMNGPPVGRSTESGPTDHEIVLRRIGLHYFGAPSLTALASPSMTGTMSPSTFSVPTIGMRYWFANAIGIEAGIGLGLSSGSASMTSNGTSTSTGVPGETAFGITAGIPIMIGNFQHLTVFVDPFLSLYYGYGAMDLNTGGGVTSYRLNSVAFRVGAAAVAEVHLGFMHLPQVSVEARLGVQLNVQNDSLDVFSNGDQTNTSAFNVGFGTTAGDFSFQNLFLSSIAATYHF